MSTIVEATVSADQFALAEALARRPSAEFETVRAAADGTDCALPFLWATADDLDGLPAVVAEDPSARDVDVLTARDDEYLFRVEWTGRVGTVCDVLLSGRGSVLTARGENDAWTFRLLFPEHSSLSATHDRCEAADLDVTFERVYDLDGPLRRGRYGLTEPQYEAVRTAYDRGFYDVPRETTLADLATELDVSHQALSERLRRGHATLVERVLRPKTAAPFTA